MQVISDEQDTLVMLLRVTLGSGDWVGFTAQVDPFQFSASGRLMPFLVTNPTALQPVSNCVVLQDTLENSLMLPEGTFAFCTTQFVPFHRSASGTPLLEALTKSPTAVQAFAAVHETPPRKALRPPLGVGVFLTVQDVPSHCSAQVPVSSEPTAWHAVADVQDTPFSCGMWAPVGTGVWLITQLVPFQCSANGIWLPEPSSDRPTAMQLFTDGQDTLIRKLLVTPVGLGVVWAVQLVPSQRRASVTMDPPLRTSPTAVHTFAPVQDTPSSEVFAALGMVPSAQNLPFQVCTSALKTLPLSSSPPTAAQKLTDGQDTVCRPLAMAACGMAGGWSCQRSDQSSTSAWLGPSGC